MKIQGICSSAERIKPAPTGIANLKRLKNNRTKYKAVISKETVIAIFLNTAFSFGASLRSSESIGLKQIKSITAPITIKVNGGIDDC